MDYRLKQYAISKGYLPLEDREDGRSYVVLWEYPDGTYHTKLPERIRSDYATTIQ